MVVLLSFSSSKYVYLFVSYVIKSINLFASFTSISFTFIIKFSFLSVPATPLKLGLFVNLTLLKLFPLTLAISDIISLNIWAFSSLVLFVFNRFNFSSTSFLNAVSVLIFKSPILFFNSFPKSLPFLIAFIYAPGVFITFLTSSTNLSLFSL